MLKILTQYRHRLLSVCVLSSWKDRIHKPVYTRLTVSACTCTGCITQSLTGRLMHKTSTNSAYTFLFTLRWATIWFKWKELPLHHWFSFCTSHPNTASSAPPWGPFSEGKEGRWWSLHGHRCPQSPTLHSPWEQTVKKKKKKKGVFIETIYTQRYLRCLQYLSFSYLSSTDSKEAPSVWLGVVYLVIKAINHLENMEAVSNSESFQVFWVITDVLL